MSCCARSELRRARPLLGTIVEIAARGAGRAALERAVASAFAECAEIHARMSFHEPGSDVTQLNRRAAATAVRVDPRTWEVLARAREIADASEGAFDVTIAPALVDWGYLPRHPGLGSSAAHGYRNIELLAGHRVRFHDRIWIDLGGIAKGFAVDRMCEVLERGGVSAYVVNAGGDLRVGREPELVHVRHPGRPGALLPLAELQEMAVATSGTYFDSRGSVHPIAVPGANRAADLRGSVSVMCRDCTTADALTKVVALRGDASRSALESFAARACRLTELGELRPIAREAA